MKHGKMTGTATQQVLSNFGELWSSFALSMGGVKYFTGGPLWWTELAFPCNTLIWCHPLANVMIPCSDVHQPFSLMHLCQCHLNIHTTQPYIFITGQLLLHFIHYIIHTHFLFKWTSLPELLQVGLGPPKQKLWVKWIQSPPTYTSSSQSPSSYSHVTVKLLDNY